MLTTTGWPRRSASRRVERVDAAREEPIAVVVQTRQRRRRAGKRLGVVRRPGRGAAPTASAPRHTERGQRTRGRDRAQQRARSGRLAGSVASASRADGLQAPYHRVHASSPHYAQRDGLIGTRSTRHLDHGEHRRLATRGTNRRPASLRRAYSAPTDIRGAQGAQQLLSWQNQSKPSQRARGRSLRISSIACASSPASRSCSRARPPTTSTPGSARQRAVDAALVELDAGRETPSAEWRRRYSLLLGLERLLSTDPSSWPTGPS